MLLPDRLGTAVQVSGICLAPALVGPGAVSVPIMTVSAVSGEQLLREIFRGTEALTRIHFLCMQPQTQTCSVEEFLKDDQS